mgnify:CR=1 FL=1
MGYATMDGDTSGSISPLSGIDKHFIRQWLVWAEKELNYSALNYLNPEKCNYTYKMEGFDNDWRPITTARSTTYTNLNPGNYTFKVTPITIFTIKGKS